MARTISGLSEISKAPNCVLPYPTRCNPLSFRYISDDVSLRYGEVGHCKMRGMIRHVVRSLRPDCQT